MSGVEDILKQFEESIATLRRMSEEAEILMDNLAAHLRQHIELRGCQKGLCIGMVWLEKYDRRKAGKGVVQ